MTKMPITPVEPTAEPAETREADNLSGKAASASGGYEVGYARPPKETQFKPGKSGNPNGRPRKKDMQGSELIAHLMSKKIQLKDGKVHPLELTFRATVKQAAAGDMRAASLMLEFEKMASASNARRAGLFDPSQAESALASYVERKARSQ